jgi:hypothetical protein
MQYRSLLSRCVASVALVAVLTVGTHSFVPAVFACGTNAGGGNCRQVSPPSPVLDGWTIVRVVELSLYLWP